MSTAYLPADDAPSRALLRPKEAACYLTISERKLWELTNRREIPHLRIGRSVRYSMADLDGWIEAQRERSCRRLDRRS